MPGIPTAVLSSAAVLMPGEPAGCRYRMDPSLLDAAAFIGRAEATTWDRASQLAVAAVRLAEQDLCGVPGDDCGVMLGTAFGCMNSAESYFDRLLSRGPRLVSPLQFAHAGTNVPASMVAIDRGWRGHNVTVSHGQASGAWALCLAVLAVTSGRLRRAAAGAVDAGSTIRSLCGDEPAEGAVIMILDAGPSPGRSIAGTAIAPSQSAAAESAAARAGLGGAVTVIADQADGGAVSALARFVDLTQSRTTPFVWVFPADGASLAFAMSACEERRQ